MIIKFHCYFILIKYKNDKSTLIGNVEQKLYRYFIPIEYEKIRAPRTFIYLFR